MPDLKSLDGAVLDRLRTYGSAKLVTRMIDLVLETAASRIETARDGYRAGNLRAVEYAAHSLKSSAGIVGADRLGALAAELEEIARVGEAEAISERLDELESAFRDTRAQLEAKRERFVE